MDEALNCLQLGSLDFLIGLSSDTGEFLKM